MKYPILSELRTSREWVDVFKGYNHNLRIGEGEFYEMRNLSSDNFPVLSPRKHRGIYASPTEPSGLIAVGGVRHPICYIDGESIVIDGKDVPMQLYPETGFQKDLVAMGSYIIVLPDRKFVNSIPEEASLYETGAIDAMFSKTVNATITLCKSDGMAYDNVELGATAPEITAEMEANPSLIPNWIDTSTDKHSLKIYSTSTKTWSTVATTYVKIAADGIGKDFSAYDGVSIFIDGNLSGIIHLIGANVIWAREDDYIVVAGIVDKVLKDEYYLRIRREMPTMDYVIESGNRLWGCRYGQNSDGTFVNEIYASKLGDFKNWQCFMGISTDSYTASVGSQGPFTGAIEYLGHPVFFKEDCMYEIYGDNPANFQIRETPCRGVQPGCARSLAVVNEVLYYKSHKGVCAYDGSLPTEVSSALGDESYSTAVAGACGNKYYICLSKIDDYGRYEYHLFAYDTRLGLWHREDNTEAVAFCSCKGNLYYIDHADNQIKSINPTETETEEVGETEWEAVTGIIGTDSPDKKYISRMDVRMSIEPSARVTFYAEYDSSGSWEYLYTADGTRARVGTFAVPIKPKRCDHLRLKISGVGDAKIFSICKTIEQGSDR